MTDSEQCYQMLLSKPATRTNTKITKHTKGPWQTLPEECDKQFYLCAPCDAYVGCHQGTTNAPGRLANTELRAAKMAAHAAFDPLWQSGAKKRGAAYAWLATALGLDPDDA